MRPLPLALPAVLLFAAAPAALAQTVDVTLKGQVEFNLVSTGPLSLVPTGQAVEITFQVDAATFVDSPTFPTRGYPIDQDTFVMDMGAGALGLADPFPPGETPYFTIRNDDPAVDGFFIANSTDFPIGSPLDLTGAFGAFEINFSVTYLGTTLTSLDIVDAAGFYDFTGLTVFGMNITDGPVDAVGMVFESLEITPQVVCGYQPYGVGITPVNDLVLDGVGTPAVGGSLDLAISGANLIATFVALSTGQADLPLFGGSLLIDPFGQFLLQPMTAGPTEATFSLPIPNNPALANFTFYAQAGRLDATKPEGIALSSGQAVTVCP